MAGAPQGNTNSSKNNRLWGDTIRRVVAQDPEGLRKAAEALVNAAKAGDLQAMRELGDRLDGKASQSVEQKTEIIGTLTHHVAPELSKDEWLKAFGR